MSTTIVEPVHILDRSEHGCWEVDEEEVLKRVGRALEWFIAMETDGPTHYYLQKHGISSVIHGTYHAVAEYEVRKITPPLDEAWQTKLDALKEDFEFGRLEMGVKGLIERWMEEGADLGVPYDKAYYRNSDFLAIIAHLSKVKPHCLPFTSEELSLVSEGLKMKIEVDNIVRAQTAHAFAIRSVLLPAILAHENRRCIGYHGTSALHSAFNDVVRRIVTIVLKIDLPANYYFFRSPTDRFEIEDADAYLDRYKAELTNVQLRQFTEVDLLVPGNALFQKNLTFDEVEIEDVEELVQLTKDKRSITSEEEYIACLKREEVVIKKYYPTFDVDVHYEKFRNIQAIITHEEDEEDIGEVFLDYCDHTPEKQKMVVSMNLALLGNHDVNGENSLRPYYSGHSIGSGADGLTEVLGQFLSDTGLDPELAEPLLMTAIKVYRSGVIIQFFEKEEGFTSIRKDGYLSYHMGYPREDRTLGEVLESREIGVHDQYRLVMSPRVRNPFGPYEMRTYALVDPEGVKASKLEMEALLASATIDRTKANACALKLRTMWGQPLISKL